MQLRQTIQTTHKHNGSTFAKTKPKPVQRDHVPSATQLQDETASDGPTPLQTDRDEEQGTTSMLQDEAILLEQLLDSISMKDTPSCAECIRGVPESPQGTPPSMDETKRVIQQTVESIKELMIDIAQASHHADHLARAAELGVLSKGLSVVPRMMLMYADDITKAEWLAQVRISTLGFMKVSERHHRRIIDKRKTEIADLQAKALKAIDGSQTNQKQKKALKGTYEELLKAAAEAARKVKDQQDLATESKLESPVNKRPRTDHERYDTHVHCQTQLTHMSHSLAPQIWAYHRRKNPNKENDTLCTHA